MNRIVITGAGGFIGTATLQRLSKKYDILAIDLPTSKLKKDKNRNYEVAYCDITSEDFHSYIKQGDKVLHLAAVSTMKAAEENPLKAFIVNVVGTLNVVMACNKAGAERLVFSSTGSVISPKAEIPFKEDAPIDPPNFYGWTKAKAEEVIQKYCKVPWIILRYGYVYGENKFHGAIGTFIKCLLKGESPTIFGGKQINDFTYVEDIVQANEKALFTPYTNQIYHIGSGRANSILDVYEICREAVGIDIPPKICPPRKGDYMVFLYDIEKARQLLKYEPKWTLKRGIKHVVELIKKEGRKL